MAAPRVVAADPSFKGGIHGVADAIEAWVGLGAPDKDGDYEASSPPVVDLAQGRYPLGDRPLRLTAAATWRSADGKARISGGRAVTWVQSEHLWRSPMPAGGSPRQLWVGETRAVRARHPNVGDGYLRWRSALPAPFERWGLVYEPGQGIDNRTLTGCEAVVFWSWTASRHVITSHDPATRTLIFDRPSRGKFGDHLQNSGRRFLLEGCGAWALDAPGEFVVLGGDEGRRGGGSASSDAGGESAETAGGGEVVYWPTAEVSAMASARLGPASVESFVATAGLTALLEVVGEPGKAKAAKGVRLEGVILEHADWMMPPAPAVTDWQAAAFLRDAAVVVRHAMGFEMAGVTVRHVGGYAVLLGQGAKRSAISNCTLADMGAGGVRIGNVDEDGIEPKRRASANSIRSSRIVDGGHVFREGVGVLVHRSQGNVISDCEIAHLGYTGVSLGWVWGYDAPSGGGRNTVRRNFIHHIGAWELADMGGVYILGRAEGTVIEENVIAHVSPYRRYGWGLYLDEGASGVSLRRNLVHHTVSAGLHQHYGTNNSIRHNVFACAGGHDGELALSIGEAHASWDFSFNIVLRCDPRDVEGRRAADDGSDGDADAEQSEAVAVGASGQTAVLPPPSALAAPYPAAPAYWLWWKGEGSKPNLTHSNNTYWSLRPEEASEELAPAWLHFTRQATKLRKSPSAETSWLKRQCAEPKGKRGAEAEAGEEGDDDW